MAGVSGLAQPGRFRIVFDRRRGGGGRGVLPVVGVTLPLFSYGGSSVLTMTICCALLINVSMRRFSSVADRL